MLPQLLTLCALAWYSSALVVKPESRSNWLDTRSDPSFGEHTAPTTQQENSHMGIVKRTDPAFDTGDFGEGPDGVSKKELLEDAFPDVYTLVWTALNTFDDTIFDHWFPSRDKSKVKAVFRAIIKNPDDPLEEVTGNAELHNFKITPADTLSASCHSCDATFGGDSEDSSDVAPVLDDLELGDFKFDGEYRITNEMEPIAATILHEITHFNTIGSQIQPDEPFPEVGAIIGDFGGPDPKTDYGEPYWARQLRGEVTEDEDKCLKNADNYVWFALESYWTEKFKDDLKDQGGYFKPPKKP